MGADFPRWGKLACDEPSILTPITEIETLPAFQFYLFCALEFYRMVEIRWSMGIFLNLSRGGDFICLTGQAGITLTL
jgi:hypothetical protein